MTDEPNRREFLRIASLAGAGAMAAGAAGCTLGGRDKGVRIDEEGYVFIDDPKIAALFDQVYEDQQKEVAKGEGAKSGLRVRYIDPDDGPGKPVINHLCDCRTTIVSSAADPESLKVPGE